MSVVYLANVLSFPSSILGIAFESSRFILSALYWIRLIKRVAERRFLFLSYQPISARNYPVRRNSLCWLRVNWSTLLDTETPWTVFCMTAMCSDATRSFSCMSSDMHAYRLRVLLSGFFLIACVIVEINLLLSFISDHTGTLKNIWSKKNEKFLANK